MAFEYQEIQDDIWTHRIIVHYSILGYIGIMGKNMETTIVYWGCSGIMAKKTVTTVAESIFPYDIPTRILMISQVLRPNVTRMAQLVRGKLYCVRFKLPRTGL